MIGGANPNEAANATSRAASLAAITRDRTASGVRRCTIPCSATLPAP